MGTLYPSGDTHWALVDFQHKVGKLNPCRKVLYVFTWGYRLDVNIDTIVHCTGHAVGA